MTFLASLLYFINQILTFYLPIFFTFKFLSSQDPQKIIKILKFWCVLSLAYIVQFVLSFALAENLDIIIDLVLHVGLIYDQFNYSQQIYDRLIKPFYKNHEETINTLSKKLQEYFQAKTAQVQSKVTQTAGDKIKSFFGEILVGTLNPRNSSRQIKEERSQSEDSSDKEE